MPIYGQVCTKKKCQSEFEDVRSMKDADVQPRCPKCGGPSQRSYDSTATQCRPEQVSDAMGIHPCQIPDAVKRFPHHRYNRRGQMLFSSNTEMQRALKDLGYVDRNKV